MPTLIKAFRDAGIRVIHIEDGDYVHKYEEYRQTMKLIKGKLPKAEEHPRPAQDKTYEELRKFRIAHVSPGAENDADMYASCGIRDIHPSVSPLPGEYMVPGQMNYRRCATCTASII